MEMVWKSTAHDLQVSLLSTCSLTQTTMFARPIVTACFYVIRRGWLRIEVAPDETQRLTIRDSLTAECY